MTENHDNVPQPTSLNGCHRTRLIDGPLASVDACECGMMHLNIGAITLRLAPCAVSELLSTLGRAVAVQAARGLRPAVVNGAPLGAGYEAVLSNVAFNGIGKGTGRGEA
jgi:hypothetical protein